MDEFEFIETNEVSLKTWSKKVMYELLPSVGGLYLPLLADSHYMFIR